jgi:hypothetical protein
LNIKSFKCLVILIPLFFIQCKSIEKSSFENNSIFKGNSSKENESKDKIDNGKTFELFFELNDDENCITINMSSESYDEILNKFIQIKTFFIVEKAIDISKFSPEKKSIFSEISRNYDYNWNTKQKILICSSKTDPIKTLNKTNNFRIRFTIYNDIKFKYEIIISSKHPVTITEKNPVIK